MHGDRMVGSAGGQSAVRGCPASKKGGKIARTNPRPVVLPGPVVEKKKRERTQLPKWQLALPDLAVFLKMSERTQLPKWQFSRGPSGETGSGFRVAAARSGEVHP
jgi:hypothetical protein